MSQEYKTKESASFKLVINYTNGNIRPYYSRDWKNGRFRPDLGLASLEKLIARNAQWVRVAMIWDKRWGREWLIRQCGNYNNGWEVCAPVKFDELT